MLITQLKASFVLLTLFLAVTIAAKAIGSFQPPNPAMRGFIEGCEDKPQPCWYGIVLNSTTEQEAIPILEKMGYVSAETFIAERNAAKFTHYPKPNCLFQLSTKDDTVNSLMLIGCLHTRLGDWLVQYPNGLLYPSTFPPKTAQFHTTDGKTNFAVYGTSLLGNIGALIIYPALS
jgi:hypothetical protein